MLLSKKALHPWLSIISQRLQYWQLIFILHKHKKTWSQSCRSFHVLRPSHCPECRNETTLKAPRRCVYNSSSLPTSICSKPKRTVYNTPCRASPLLCSWHSVWSCEVLTRQNQSVQLRLNMYMSPWPPAFLWAFGKGIDCKDSDNFDKSYQKMAFFSWKQCFSAFYLFLWTFKLFLPLFYLMQSWYPTNIFCDFNIFW